ncbi:MAG: hypothetical protein ABIJ75_03650 [Actinomycetota bacterium]
MRRILFALLIVGVLAGGVLAGALPTNQRGSITVSNTAVGFPTTACRSYGTTGPEYPAVIQVQTNGIYFLLNSATATPVATDFIGYAGDYIPVPKPSQFRAIRSGSSDAKLAYQCFTE